MLLAVVLLLAGAAAAYTAFADSPPAGPGTRAMTTQGDRPVPVPAANH